MGGQLLVVAAATIRFRCIRYQIHTLRLVEKIQRHQQEMVRRKREVYERMLNKIMNSMVIISIWMEYHIMIQKRIAYQYVVET